MIIYKVTNKINGKIYIGQTTGDLHKRWRRHCLERRCRALSNAILKYGKNNFEIKIIVRCDSMAQMNHREVYYIKLFNSLSPNGYNLSKGGLGCIGLKPSDITRLKLSRARKLQKHPFEGKKHSKQSRKRMSDAQKGIKHHRFGKSLTESHRANIAKGVRKRAVKCNETGKVYDSIRLAAIDTGCDAGNIHAVLNGKYKSSKGLTFVYIN